VNFFDRLYHAVFRKKVLEPVRAYDLWSLNYDDQPDNLMLNLDEQIVNELLNEIEIEHKIVVDIGCGTGRHWPKLFQRQPKQLIGFDTSRGMLQKLSEKFPTSETHLITDNKLAALENSSVGVLVSTLTVAHIDDVAKAFTEWNRVLKPGADMLITDYHPETLAKGGDRTFQHKGKTLSAKNYIHFMEEIQRIAEQLRWSVERLIEIRIDEDMKPWYEKKNALHVYEKFKGTPIIYGLHLKKADATSQ
jgi:ubiquinone/menaquinone biosynthesis C-methylase UbiE